MAPADLRYPNNAYRVVFRQTNNRTDNDWPNGCAIRCDSMKDDVYNALDSIRSKYPFGSVRTEIPNALTMIRFKDRFIQPFDSGYHDILMNFGSSVKNGKLTKK
jgi:hypothetical protein